MLLLVLCPRLPPCGPACSRAPVRPAAQFFQVLLFAFCGRFSSLFAGASLRPSRPHPHIRACRRFRLRVQTRAACSRASPRTKVAFRIGLVGVDFGTVSACGQGHVIVGLCKALGAQSAHTPARANKACALRIRCRSGSGPGARPRVQAALLLHKGQTARKPHISVSADNFLPVLALISAHRSAHRPAHCPTN